MEMETVDAPEAMESMDMDANGNVDGGEGIEQTQEQPTMYEVDIDGEKLEVDIEELRRGYQLAKASHKKFRTAEDLKKQASFLPEYLRSNPIEALKYVGVDFDQLAENHILKQAEYDMLDETEKRAYDAEKMADQREKELQYYKEMHEKREHDSRVNNYTQQITTSLEQEGFEVSQPLVSEVARELEYLWNTGHQNANVVDAVKSMKQKRYGVGKETIGQLGVEDLIEALGPEKLKQLRNHDLQKLQQGNFYNQDINLEQAKPFNKKSRKISKDDWKNHLRMIENM